MAVLTIRGIDEETKSQLRIRAAQHNRSMEAEVRAILQDVVLHSATESGLGSRLHALFADLGGGIELELPSRVSTPRAVEFDT